MAEINEDMISKGSNSPPFEINENGSLMIYQNEKGDTKVDVLFRDGNIWMTQAAIAELYQTRPQNITQHIKNLMKVELVRITYKFKLKEIGR